MLTQGEEVAPGAARHDGMDLPLVLESAKEDPQFGIALEGERALLLGATQGDAGHLAFDLVDEVVRSILSASRWRVCLSWPQM